MSLAGTSSPMPFSLHAIRLSNSACKLTEIVGPLDT